MTRARRREAGTATAELAVALPALVLVLAVSLAALDLGVSQVRCVDAARTAARLVARGGPEAEALAEARRAGPPGAVITVGTSGSRVSVEVVGPVPTLLGPLGLGAPRATAVARLEAAP